MKRVYTKSSGFFLLLLILILNYNNCSSSKMDYEKNPIRNSSLSSLQSIDICSQTESEVFAQGYHTFLKTTCNTCHVSGPGKGAFAHPDANLAFNSFQTLGVEKISSMAVNDSHKYPYTGSQNIETVNNYKTQWNTFQIERTKCGNSSLPSNPTNSNELPEFTPQFITQKKVIPTITGTPATISVNGTNVSIIQYNTVSVTFNLDTELSSLSNKAVPLTSGGTLKVSITGFSTASGATGYIVEMPTLKTNTSSLHIKGLHPILNGRPVSYAYTFQHIDQNIYKLSEVMLSGGSMLILGPLINGDQISFSIGDLEVIDMNAPPLPPEVQFSITNTTILNSNLGFSNPYSLVVTRSGETSNPVTVSIEATGDETKPNIARGSLDSTGRRRFNWDYQFLSSKTISFLPGETTKNIEIVFSDDLRDEPDKTLTLKLGDPFGATLGANSTIVISIPDYNAPPLLNEVTFTNLMSVGGILEMNCVRCHNSIEKQGGYDMTNYQEMVTKGVIVPGDSIANNHKMFRRMNPDTPEAGTITPMPLDDYLSQDLRDAVESWIISGAKNN